MSKYTNLQLWNERYGNREEVYDYSGRLMKKSACNNICSQYTPTIDHIRPQSKGGSDIKENIVICNKKTNYEKSDKFPHWKTNGRLFRAIKNGNGYEIEEL